MTFVFKFGKTIGIPVLLKRGLRNHFYLITWCLSVSFKAVWENSYLVGTPVPLMRDLLRRKLARIAAATYGHIPHVDLYVEDV